jgi:two-component system, NarL family, sensor histidine kinase DegS
VRQKNRKNWLIAVVRRPGVWSVVVLFLLVTFLQNTEFLKPHTSLVNLGITRYTIERILYLLPIFWAAFLFGWKGGSITTLAALAGMVPAAVLASPRREDALVEISAVFIIGGLMSYSLESLRRERERSAKLEVAEKELQFFLQQITRAQEEERRRIAWELHDETIQSLVALCQQIDDLASSVKGLPRKARSRLEDLHQHVNAIMQEVRRISQDLRPATLDNLGLVAALEWLASNMERYSGTETHLKIISSERRFSTEVELVLFRIVQEALKNVQKHAQASSAQVTLEFLEGKTMLTISDNGKGFIPPPEVTALPKAGKLGLAGMMERARSVGGTMWIKSEPDKGTSVIAELPL